MRRDTPKRKMAPLATSNIMATDYKIENRGTADRSRKEPGEVAGALALSPARDLVLHSAVWTIAVDQIRES
jgi:hypothetical protein